MEEGLRYFVMIDKIKGKWYAKLHDKKGNFSVYEVPETLPETYEDVMKSGILVATKTKGDMYRKPDGSKDQDYRLYGMLRELEPTVPKVPVEIKGNKTTYTQLGEDFFYKGSKIVKMKRGMGVEYTKPCHKCGGPIRFMANVSFKDGKPWTLTPGLHHEESARTIHPSSTAWEHVDCEKRIEEKEKEKVKDPVEKEKPEPKEKTVEEEVQVETSPVLDLLAELEKITLDEKIGDEFVRGATWAVCRLFKGSPTK